MKSGREEAQKASSSSIEKMMTDITSTNLEEPFYILDLQDILSKHKNWLLKMPRIRPFYAVKCNPCPLVLELLAALGTGFDCASKSEIDAILDIAHPDNIIYANPCKTKSYIKHAKNVGVDLMTFDNEHELHKVAKIFPNARMVIRIKVDDSHSVCQFSSKFGADLDQVAHLLQVAKDLDLDVVGVSFHVGSGCENAKSYSDAISNARYVYEVANKIGFNFTLLDIGGGFPGTSGVDITFDEIASVVNQSLDEHFPEDMENFSIIAEPGRYYVASAFTLNTMVIAKRLMNEDDGKKRAMYYLNDGVYGSFNCIIFDHWIVNPFPLSLDISADKLLTTLWGPTCDAMDCIKKDVMLQEMEIGDLIVFPEMGAYTISAASTFNGFSLPSIKYHISDFVLEFIQNLPNWPRIRKMINMEELDTIVEKDYETFESGFPDLISVH